MCVCAAGTGYAFVCVGLCVYVSLYIYVAKKSTRLEPITIRKNPACVYYTAESMNLNNSKVVFYFQRVVQMEQFMHVLCMAPEYCMFYVWPRNIALWYTMPYCYALCNM